MFWMPVMVACLWLGQFVPFPKFVLRRRFAKEQHLPVLGFVGVGIQQQDALLLLHAGQVKQIGVGHSRQSAVGVGGRHVIGVEDNQRIGRQQCFQPRAVVDKKFGIDRFVAHVVSSLLCKMVPKVRTKCLTICRSFLHCFDDYVAHG